MKQYTGTYCLGYGIASGQGLNRPGYGSLAMQRLALSKMNVPHVREVLDVFETCYVGTINVTFEGSIPDPDWQYIIPDVPWHPDFAAEDLRFHPVTLHFNSIDYVGFWYKGGENLHGNSKAEFLAPWIDGLIPNESKITISY